MGTKLFLKGEKCFTPQCPLIRKPYPPGTRGKRKAKPLSEYGKELREKQKLKNWYNLRETQFKNYVKEALEKKGQVEDTSVFLIQKLEKRLDNVIFRLGFAKSRAQARQMVSHRHFMVNGRVVNIPSYQVKIGDKISIREGSKKKKIFEGLKMSLKKYQPPSWLKIDPEKLEGEVIKEPTVEEAGVPVELSAVFEFYSK